MRIWIPGAWSTKYSFNYLKTQMVLDDDLFIEYATDSNLIETINKMKKKIEKHVDDDQIDLIGHSLGGVICVILYHLGLKNVRSITTMSAPFGGITNNKLMRFWFPRIIFGEFYKLEKEYSNLIEKKIEVPYLFFVSNKGRNPLFLGAPNDGVVTVESQKAIKKVKYKDVSLNHYEILMDENVASKIKEFHKNLKI